MKPRICLAMCTALVFGATMAVLAQDPSSAKPYPSQNPSQSASAKAITVTGCIEHAQPSPAGTTGATGTAPAAAEAKFMLTKTSSKASDTPTGTAGAAPSSAWSASEYKLDASESKLSSHVGHKVEITGTIEPASPSAPAADAPTLKVDSVKMVASSCS
jgi:hypothetical protein